MTVNDKMEMMQWKEVAMTYFQVLSQHFYSRNEMSQIILVSIAALQTENRTRNLIIKKQECQSLRCIL